MASGSARCACSCVRLPGLNGPANATRSSPPTGGCSIFHRSLGTARSVTVLGERRHDADDHALQDRHELPEGQAWAWNRPNRLHRSEGQRARRVRSSGVYVKASTSSTPTPLGCSHRARNELTDGHPSDQRHAARGSTPGRGRRRTRTRRRPTRARVRGFPVPSQANRPVTCKGSPAWGGRARAFCALLLGRHTLP
jgi:hypothetical protein